jgi:DNA-binding NarL/FixJ family response regulator
MPIRILVVDDYEPFRAIVREIITRDEGLPAVHIVSEAGDGSEAIQRAEELLPDVVLLDLSLPNVNGFEAARQIRVKAPEAKIVIVSQHCSPSLVQAALAIGAHGYVAKWVAAHELVPAIQAVIQDRRFISKVLEGFDFSGASDELWNA